MIISILGTAGAVFDRDSCSAKRDDSGEIIERVAQYDASIFQKKRKSYKNSTHFLLENFDKKFVFIGTKCAIDFQKEILSEEIKDKDIEYREIKDNDLDDIFEVIYALLEDKDDVLLDITHGFRHQPIMAIFASTLSQFLERKKLKIIFAKEVEQYKTYQYIYLDEYIEITHISLLLTGFIRTLNFIPTKSMKFLKHKVFENFSTSLLSNDLVGVEKNYKELMKELDLLLKNQELKHLFNLFEQVKEELLPLEGFDTLKSYEKYLALAKLTIEKNYLIVSLAYIFESFREYCSLRFKGVSKSIKFRNSYDINTSVMDTIGNFRRAGKMNKLQKKYPNIYKDNKSNFKRVSIIYAKVQSLRNDLAHINKIKDFKDIKLMLHQIIFMIEQFYKDDVLKDIKV